MRLLKWTETIKQPLPVSKEEFLSTVEKTEILYLVATGLWTLFAFFGLFLILLAPTGSKGTWIGLSSIGVGGTGYLESTIKGYLKLERYKAAWEQNNLMETEMRKSEAMDI